MKIAEVSEQSGLSPDTLRYYERIGRRLPAGAILGTCLFLIGTSSAAIAPYRAIAAIDTLGISNSIYALIMTMTSVGTAIASLVMGHFSDRIPDRRILVLASAGLGAMAYGLLYLFPAQLTDIIAFTVIMPFGGALFSQTFSFSRVYYDQRQPDRAEFMMSVLRSLFTAAWIIGAGRRQIFQGSHFGDKRLDLRPVLAVAFLCAIGLAGVCAARA